MGPTRGGRTAWCLALGLLCPPGHALAAHEGPEAPHRHIVTRLVPLGEISWGLLSIPAGTPAGERLPAVVVIGDAGGQDGRVQLYALRLLSLGFAVLDADYGGPLAGEGALDEPDPMPPAARLAAVLPALRTAPELDPRRVAAIGIGEGARGIVHADPTALSQVAAAVLLYPGCDAAVADAIPRGGPARGRAATPLLLVHGDADPAEVAACGVLEASLGGGASGISRYVLRGAGFAWDLDGGSGRGASLLPDPARPGERRRAEPDPQRALIALDQVLLFLLRALEPPASAP